jgi:hypothetical protein
MADRLDELETDSTQKEIRTAIDEASGMSRER